MPSIEQLNDIALKAGHAILEIYNKDFGIQKKSDGTPVTKADLKANEIICSELRRLYPNIPLLSEEETIIPYCIRRNWSEYFLIDPLDGTREFIKRNGEFTVNIAYIKNSYPIMGVVYAPVSKELYYAQENNGAYLQVENQIRKLPLTQNTGPQIRLVSSRSHKSTKLDALILKLEKAGHQINMVNVGSSLKFCLLAKGEAEVYPRFNTIMEWDSGAAQIILEESGGSLTLLDGKRRLYYNKESLKNLPFIGLSKNGQKLDIKFKL